MKYDASGQMYRVVHELPDNELLVAQQLEDCESGDAYDGELRIVFSSALHDEPPRMKLHEEIDGLRKSIDALTNQRGELLESLRDFELQEKDRMARLKQHKALQRLDDFVAGKITHYVENEYKWRPPKIIPLSDTKGSDRHSRDLRLLSVFGQSNGDLEWQLNQYYDWSGMWTTVIPCASLEEAVQIVQTMFDVHHTTVQDDDKRPSQDWIDAAADFGIATPNGYVDAVASNMEADRLEKITKLEAKLAELHNAK